MSMRCPHCDIAFHDEWDIKMIKKDSDGWDAIRETICPTCGKMTLVLLHDDWGKPVVKFGSSPAQEGEPKELERQIYPRRSNRKPCPIEVPKEFAEDYNEACLILADSPKASAALSRRCLQHLLREKAGVNNGQLWQEIKEVVDGNKLPSDLGEQLDVVRHYGNFAAHPEKDKVTGEIIPVEPGEAEWILDILEELFDFYFVRPERIKKKRGGLNIKLASAGKQQMK